MAKLIKKNSTDVIEAKHGLVLPDWDKVKSTLNPKNWGIPDYSDKGDFDAAFSAARKAGEKEFIWNNKRFTTNKDTDPIIKNPKNEREVALNNYYKKYYPEFVKNYNSNRPNVNIHSNRLSNPSESKPSESKPSESKPFRASYNSRSKTLNIEDYNDETGDFIAELAHHKQKNGIGETIKKRYEFLKYGDDRRYDVEGTVEYNTHRLTEPALYMQREGNLSKEDILKLQKYLKVKEDGILGQDTYKAIVDKYHNPKKFNEKYPDSYNDAMSRYYLLQIAKDPNINLKGLVNNKKYHGEDDNWEGAYFDDNQLLKLNPNNKNFDTLALQRELSNRGYKLPKSTTEDGTFDGILGDETKNALLDWQNKNKIKVQDNYVASKLLPKATQKLFPETKILFLKP